MNRVAEARAKNPAAQLSLNEWYNFIAGSDFTESQNAHEHCGKLVAWAKEKPNSPTPLIAQAKALIEYAWYLRGTGFSSTVIARDQNAFRGHIAEARKLLDQAIKLGVKDGEAH